MLVRKTVTSARWKVRKMQKTLKAHPKKLTAAGILTLLITWASWYFGLPAPPITINPPQPAPAAYPAPAADTSPDLASRTIHDAPVLRIVDGDTFKTHSPRNPSKQISVRIVGIDTPETVHPHQPIQPYGPEASAAARELLNAHLVTLTIPADMSRYDRYGRLLAYVTLPDGRDYGSEMLYRGLARTTPQYPHPRSALYESIQLEAQDAKRGLWSQ